MGGWAIVAVVFVAYALAARRLDQLSITAPIVLVAAGAVLGAGYLDVLPANVTTESIRLVTELTLALILFADASTVPLRAARDDAMLPVRLLGIGLPLTIALGALAAHLLFPDISWWEAALISSILAPTDAALGMAVVTNPAVPVRIRRALNIESGLNDGIVTPFVSVFLVFVISGVATEHWTAHADRRAPARSRHRDRSRICRRPVPPGGKGCRLDDARVRPAGGAESRVPLVHRSSQLLGKRLRRGVRRGAGVRVRHSRRTS